MWSRMKKIFRKQQHSVVPHYDMDDEHIKHESFDEWEVWGEDGKYEERRITWPKPETPEPATSCFTDNYDVTSVSSDVISVNATTYDVTTDNTRHDDTGCSDNKPHQRKKGRLGKNFAAECASSSEEENPNKLHRI